MSVNVFGSQAVEIELLFPMIFGHSPPTGRSFSMSFFFSTRTKLYKLSFIIELKSVENLTVALLKNSWFSGSISYSEEVEIEGVEISHPTLVLSETDEVFELSWSTKAFILYSYFVPGFFLSPSIYSNSRPSS